MAGTSPAETLQRSFPAHASRVLRGSESFVTVNGGFGHAVGGDPAAAVGRRGGLSLALPKKGDEALRFHVIGGFEVRVRENGASGDGRLAQGAVAYGRKGGTSYWTATEDGYEEWLMLDAGVATGREPVATWEIEGATVREGNGAIEIAGPDGVAKVYVTAPIAYAASGFSVPVRLSVSGSRIELWADSAGEPVLVDPVWSATGSLTGMRHSHAAVVLNTGVYSGRVMVIGGTSGSSPLQAVELYNPADGTWSSAASLITGRAYHQAVVLSNGKVLVIGGYGTAALNSAEIYDPSLGAAAIWSPAGTMTSARYRHAAVLLESNGKVLVTGGSNGSQQLDSAELYDPSATGNPWSDAGTMSDRRWVHTATWLPTVGKVLVAGGYNGSYLSTAQLYDPMAGSPTTAWATPMTMPAARGWHTATRISGDSKVLLTGGIGSSNNYLPTTAVYTVSGGAWTTGGSMTSERAYHVATLLSNGKVLVAGGYNSTTGASLKTAEIYDPTAQSWAPGGEMFAARRYHTASAISGGKILVAGGLGSSALPSAELFDPAADSWASAASLGSTYRWYHTATPLSDGKVWVAGGTTPILGDLSSTQVYDPSLNTWSNTANIAPARQGHTATLLQDGKVLVAGGSSNGTPQTAAQVYDPDTNGYVTGVGAMITARTLHTATVLPGGKVLVAGGLNGSARNSSEIYNPATQSWTSTNAPMNTARYGHTAVLIGTGATAKVLVAGGYSTSDWTSTAELYDQETGSWTLVTSMSTARGYHSATLLPDGRVLVAGGRAGTYLQSAEIYDPAAGSWGIVTVPAMSTPRAYHTATAIANGWVLVAGGQGPGATSSVDIYNVASNTWLPAAPMNAARYQHTATPLPSGKVLMAGGYNQSTTEVYTPVADTNPCTTDTWDTNLKQVVRANKPSGAVCTDDGNPCTTDTCNGSGTCLHPVAPIGTSCGIGLVCNAGACTSGCFIGGTFYAPAAVNPSNACQVCTPGTSTITWSPRANGTACNDGNVCTQTDTCQAGVCTGSSPVPDGATCDDGNPCTHGDACQAGICVGVNSPAGVSCSENNPCKANRVCDGSGSCNTGANLPDGTSCGGDLCTPKHCSAGVCVAVPNPPLGDGDPCDGDNASPCMAGAICQNGQCTPTVPNGTPCSDGDACNGLETCQNGVCQPGTPIAAPDAGSDPCVSYACDPDAGTLIQKTCLPINPTVPSDVATANGFEAADGGADAGPIDVGRAAVLLGVAKEANGAPIPNVTISIVGAPELGTATTALDGRFVMVVNGGGNVRVRYEKQGYLTVERPADARWKEYTWLPDVVLTRLDVMVTDVTLSSSDLQSARGGLVQDEDGVRQATVLFPPLTQARIVRGGSIESRSTGTLAIRATEFTVGPTGREAMPGPLPPSTAYTYAVELTVDGALDADSVQFVDSQGEPQELPFYVENFINFRVGSTVPMGYYDRRQGVWVPSEDGRVIKILGEDAGGLALIDSDGDNVADNHLNLSSDERAKLVELYAVGQTLWRVPITHFTPWDANWPFMPPDDACSEGDSACQPGGPKEKGPKPNKGCTDVGSVIECQGQVLGEAMPVAGTPYALHYASDRAPGRREDYRLTIPLIGTSPPPASLRRIELDIQVAGKIHKETFTCPCDNLQPYVFEWDGTDVFGRTTQGAQPAVYELTYVYPAVYAPPPISTVGAVFGGGAGSSAGAGATAVVGNYFSANRVQNEVAGPKIWRGSLGTWDERGAGLGGWSLDVHHVYDPTSRVLYRGDGTRRSNAALPTILTTIAGSSSPAAPQTCMDLSTGCSAKSVDVGTPEGVVVELDGTVLFADVFYDRIGKVHPDGRVETWLPITNPEAMARAADGSVYVATFVDQPGAFRIWKIAPDKTVTLIAGNGLQCGTSPGMTPCDFEGNAADAAISSVNGLSVGPDGSLYVAEGLLVRRVSPDGKIHKFAGTGSCDEPDPTTPKKALLWPIGFPKSIVVAADGNVYIGSTGCFTSNPAAIRVVTPSGNLAIVAGGVSNGFGLDGNVATQTTVMGPYALTLTHDGLLVYHDSDRVRIIGPDGIVRTLAGPSGCGGGYCGDGVPAGAGNVGSVLSLTTAPDGSIVIGTRNIPDGRILRIAPPLPRFGFGKLAVVSEDGGELYEFDASGRHLRTYDALNYAAAPTNATRREFTYDSSGRLTSIKELAASSFTTNIDYTNPAEPKITGPFGDETRLVRDAHGNLSSLIREGNPGITTDDEIYTLTASPDGLLTSFRDPMGTLHASTEDAHEFTYDVSGNEPTGRLTCDTDPNGVSKTLTMASATTNGETTFTISKTTTGDLSPYDTKYKIVRDKKGTETRTNELPGASTAAIETITKDLKRTVTLPDGTVIEQVPHADPRFGVQALTYKTTTVLPLTVPGVGQLWKVVDAERTLDAQGLHEKTTIVKHNGQSCSLSANKTFEVLVSPDGHTVTYTTPAGRTWSMTRDQFGRVVSTNLTKLGLGTSSVSYTPAHGQLDTTTVTTEDGQQTRAVGRTYYTTGSSGTLGRLKTVTDSAGHEVRFDQYDRMGRLAQQVLVMRDQYGVELLDSPRIGFGYDANGNLVQLEPPRITPQVGSSTTLQAQHHFSHTPLDFLEGYWITDADPQNPQPSVLTSHVYTPDRLLKTVNRPEGGDPIQVQSTFGRMDSMTLPAIYAIVQGVSTQMLPSDTISLGYNPATGQLETITGPATVANGMPVLNETLGFAYNGGLVTSVTWGGFVNGTVSWEYNNCELNVRSETAGGVPLYFGRDADGMPTCVSASAIGQTCTDLSIGYKLSTNGELTALLGGTTLPGGGGISLQDSYGYNGFGDVTSYTATVGTSPVVYYDEDYTPDAIGRIASRTEQIRNAGGTLDTHTYDYTYDDIGRLKQVVANGVTIEYEYDANGNRLRRSVSNGPAEDGTYDVEDHQLSYAGRSFAYTASGRLESTSIGSSKTWYTYDALGNLRRVDLPSGTRIDYVVDGAGRRVGKMVNSQLRKSWLYSGQLQIAAEIDHTTTPATVTRFAYGTKANVPDLMIRGSEQYRIFSDHLGSPRLVVKRSDGTVVGRWDYDEFGRRTVVVPFDLPFGFAGGLYDADTGLVRFGARDYDPVTGRWTAKEPLGVTESSNVYVYAENEPVDHLDVDGLAVAPSRSELVGLANLLGVGSTAAVITEHQDAAMAAAHGDDAGMVCHARASLQAAAMSISLAVVAVAARAPVGRLGKPISFPNPAAPRPRNAPATLLGRRFSGHALDRMQERGYTPTVIDNAIRHGTGTPQPGRGTILYQDPVNKFKVSVDAATGQVVTVF